MLKNISRLECKVNERPYLLLCDMESPLNELREALNQFLSYVNQVEEAYKANQEDQKESVVEAEIIKDV